MFSSSDDGDEFDDDDTSTESRVTELNLSGNSISCGLKCSILKLLDSSADGAGGRGWLGEVGMGGLGLGH